MNEGFIKVYRSLLDWEWFGDASTSRVFMYLLLRANWKPNRWRGIEIGRGETLETSEGIAKALNISRQSVRTALFHLKSTNEITTKLTRYGMVIKVIKYADFQGDGEAINHETNHEINQESTTNQPGSNHTIRKKEEKEIKKERREGLRSPSLPEVERYFKEHGYKAEPFPFWEYYNRREWKDQNGRQLDWILKAGDWEAREKQMQKKEDRIVIPNPWKSKDDDFDPWEI